jgi:hypothetical protein
VIQPRESLRASMDHLSTPRGEHWMDKGTALCSEVDPDLFYPEQGDWASAKIAKALCAACPLQADCLDNADTWGIWGGVTERDRQGKRGPFKEKCVNDHDLTVDNARLTRGGCRACHNDRGRRYKASKKEAS